MASFRKLKRQSLEGPFQDTPAKSKKRKMSDLLGDPWTPTEVEAFFTGQQQHGSAWEKVAALVHTRSPEQCEALFTLNKTYLSLPEGIKSVQGLTAMMTDHFNSLEEASEPESSLGARERTPEPALQRTPKRSPTSLPHPAKRARTGVPVGKRTPRQTPQPPDSRADLLRTPPRATRSGAAERRSPPWSEGRTLRPRDVSRSPIMDRGQQRMRVNGVGSPSKGKAAVRDEGLKHNGLKHMLKALEAVEEQEKNGKGEGGGASLPPKKLLSKKAHIMAKVQAQRRGAERSVSSGEEKAGSQAELEDHASSRRRGGEGKDSREDGARQERGTAGEEEIGDGFGGHGVESSEEEDVPIMKRLDLASPQAERRPAKKRKGEGVPAFRSEAAESDSGSETTRSDELPIHRGGSQSKAVSSKRATPQKKAPQSPRKEPKSAVFQGPASGLDVLSSVVVAGDGLHSPPNASTSASPAHRRPEVQSTAKSRLPPNTPPRTPSSAVKARVAATPPRPKPSPARPKPRPKPKATPEKVPLPLAASSEDSPPDVPIMPAKSKERSSASKPPPSPKPARRSPHVAASPAKSNATKSAGRLGAVDHSEDTPIVSPEPRKRKRKPGVEKLPPVPPLQEAKEPEKKPRPRPRPRPPPASPSTKSAGAQPANSNETQENTPLKPRNKKKPSRPVHNPPTQRLGALTFVSPPPPRPRAHCPHTDHPAGPAHSRKAHLMHCLNSRVRRWCLYEWFYSALDYPWFARNEFVEYLEHAGLGGVKRLSRTEWGVIRSSLGHPRRLSR